MANQPDIRSKEQIIGQIIDGIISRLPELNDFTRTSALKLLVDAIAQSQFKASADIIGQIDANSTDRATGEALQRKARDNNVPIYAATPSNTKISITDKSFSKISSFIYSGQPAPVAGSLSIYVVDASKFDPAGGKLYIGRGTQNFEGPLDYTAVTAQSGGAYYKIDLAVTSPTTKFHNIGEGVVMAQGGNRLITVGSQFQTAQGASVQPVTFTSTLNATIPDGEVTVENVPVRCSQPGKVGEVAKGAIKVAVGLSFPADVTNPIPATGAREADTEDDIRSRIKAYEQAKAKGTELALQVAAIDVVAPDELKKVLSASIARYTDGTVALIFDDGTGYELNFVGAPFETVVDSALGGEKELQLRQRPIAQARVRCVNEGPYNFSVGKYLAVEISGSVQQHYLDPADFQVAASATPFEIASSINANSNLHFLASTGSNGTQVVIWPKDRNVNNIRVVTSTLGTNANDILGFPTNTEYTLRLYQDDQPLVQDGITAKVSSRSQSTWSSSIISGDTLKYIVDKTLELTITFTNSDFQVFDQSAVMSFTQPLSIWAQVLNAKMPGVVTTINGDTLDFASARGSSDSASIEFTGGTLLNKIFTSGADLSKVGQSSDFTLNRQTGQLELSSSLPVSAKITAGSQFTRAKVLTASLPNGPTQAGRSWFIIDGASKSIPNGLAANSIVTFNKTGTKLTITATTPLLAPVGFSDVQVGDWLLIWANPSDPAALNSNQGYWRVETVTTGQIVVDDGTTSRSNLGIAFTPLTDRIVLARSSAPIQLLDFTVGSLVNLTNEVKAKLLGVNADIVGSSVRIATNTFDDYGEIHVVAADQGGSNLDLPVGEIISNVSSHYAFNVTADSEAKMPSFTHSVLGTAITDANFTSLDYLAIGGRRQEFLELLDKYQTSPKLIQQDSNKGRRVWATDYDTALNRLYTRPPRYMQAGASVMQAGDRYFLRQGYVFDSKDTSSIIMDADSVTKSFTLPVSRKLTVSSHSTPTTQDFSANDGESSLALNDAASFNGFDFNDFQILRQARAYLTDGSYQILVKSIDFGQAGEGIGLGFAYPDLLTQTSLSHRFNISDLLSCDIILPVTTPRVANWDHTTSFTAAVTTTGGKDTVVFTYRTGTQPDFSVTGAQVQVGDIVMISSGSFFLPQNQGIKGRVSAVSALSFSVEIPTGQAISDNLSVQSIVNQNGTVTINTATSHGVVTGNRVALWNTATTDGLAYPLNTTYIPNVISPTQFTVPTPVGTPGGLIQTATHVNNVITVNTPSPHNLVVGNMVLISGVGSGSYDGLAAVYSIPTANQFQLVKSGSSSPISSIGRFDFQSLGNSTVAPIATMSKSGYVVTVNTGSNHGLAPGDLVSIASTTVDAWSNVTPYNPGDIILYSGFKYVSLTINTNQQPDISPTHWAVTTLDLTGIFIVDTAPTLTQFTYYYHQSGSMTTTGGTSTKQAHVGAIARSLGATNALQFAEVQTTAQEVVDYINTTLSDKFQAQVSNAAPSAVINESTEDLGLGTNYLSGSITAYSTLTSSRIITLTSSINAPKGSQIQVSGLAGGDAVYNGSYVVLESVQSGLNYLLTVWSSVVAQTTASNVVAGTFVGSTAHHRLYDGLNSVKVTALGSLAGFPQFTAKQAWADSLAVGESVYLVAMNADHLVRFWNRLVVTGLSNVGRIDYSQYGRQIQISSNTFGNAGAVQVTGGSANTLTLALVGSSSEITSRLGVVRVPYEIRRGLVPGQWLEIANQIRQNKQLGFDATTTLQCYSDGIGISAGLGSFQTQRATTQDATTIFKIERHGDFMAIVGVGGTSPGLATAGVKEGDWVRLKNIDAATYNPLTSYSIGQRANYNGLNYTSLVGSNLGNQPDISPASWELQEFNQSNQGIYQVVRTFGQDSFWIEAGDLVEEMITLGDANNIKFYSYDSVMPGDVLVITTNILGAQNVGRYVVLDEAAGPGYYFPTATRIYTQTLPNPPGAPVGLGGEFSQVNVEEAQPLSLWKQIHLIGPSDDSGLAIITSTPDLTNRLSSSLGAYLTAKGKLEFSQSIRFGVDAYKYYLGLPKELNRVIYGDPSDSINYPGWKAAGTGVDIKPAIFKRIKLGLSVRIRTGIPFVEIRERIKAAVAGYINSLKTGEQVSISRCVAAANSIPGVLAVSVTSPTYDASNDRIAVGMDERAWVQDPTVDITVSVVGS